MANEYFNHNFKKYYIEETKSRNSKADLTIDLLFRRISETEYRLGKDLYDFTTAEILGYYKYLNITSLESLMIMNNQYKLYTAYALKEGLVRDNQNHYAEIDNRILFECLNTVRAESKIITREKLIEILNSSDVENVSDKVMALAIFEGIGGKEMTELTLMEPQDINVQKRTIKLYGGRELSISPQLMDWCLESANEYEFYNSMNTKHNKKYLETDTRIIKRLSNSTVDTDHQRHKTINRRLDHLISCTNCNAFTIASLKESGRLDMIKSLRALGKPLTEVLKNKDMLYRYGKIYNWKRYCLKYGLD